MKGICKQSLISTLSLGDKYQRCRLHNSLPIFLLQPGYTWINLLGKAIPLHGQQLSSPSWQKQGFRNRGLSSATFVYELSFSFHERSPYVAKQNFLRVGLSSDNNDTHQRQGKFPAKSEKGVKKGRIRGSGHGIPKRPSEGKTVRKRWTKKLSSFTVTHHGEEKWRRENLKRKRANRLTVRVK